MPAEGGGTGAPATAVPALPEGKTAQQQQTGRERKLRHTRWSEHRVSVLSSRCESCERQAASETRRKGKGRRGTSVAGHFGAIGAGGAAVVHGCG